MPPKPGKKSKGKVSPGKKPSFVDQIVDIQYEIAQLTSDIIVVAGLRSIMTEAFYVNDDYWTRIIIDKDEITPDDVGTLQGIADQHGAKLHLHNGRLAFWPNPAYVTIKQ